MDPRHALDTLALLRDLAHGASRPLAVLVVLHDLTLAARFADRAVVLRADGTIAAAGPAPEVLVPGILDPVFEVQFSRLTGEPDGGQVALIPSRVAPLRG